MTKPDSHPVQSIEGDETLIARNKAPNFPTHPYAPWVVIAAPLAHLTVYPETIDYPDSEAEDTPRARFLKKQKCRGGHVLQKRGDYDFSHGGVPIFEFSNETNKDPFFDPKHYPFLAAPYLSVEGIGAYHFPDPYAIMPVKEWHVAQAAIAEYSNAVEEHNAAVFKQIVDDRRDGSAVANRGFGNASPFYGLWWRQFYDGVAGDMAKWRNVKRCMGRGGCRAVVRWSEWKERAHVVAEPEEQDDVEKFFIGMVEEEEGKGPVAPPLNLIGMKARDRRKAKKAARRPSKLSVDDGTMPIDGGFSIDVGEGHAAGDDGGVGVVAVARSKPATKRKRKA